MEAVEVVNLNEQSLEANVPPVPLAAVKVPAERTQSNAVDLEEVVDEGVEYAECLYRIGDRLQFECDCFRRYVGESEEF